ncbi:MAG: hypothetical protein LBS56_10280 [Propionibacteriaceae bacterium]|nr:hypothetical protein [Propionibacteriaceae bacterium]
MAVTDKQAVDAASAAATAQTAANTANANAATAQSTADTAKANAATAQAAANAAATAAAAAKAAADQAQAAANTAQTAAERAWSGVDSYIRGPESGTAGLLLVEGSAMTVVDDSTVIRGKVYRAAGLSAIVDVRNKIEVRDGMLYRCTFVVRVTGSGTPVGTLWAGVSGWAANKATPVNVVGDASHYSQHYFAASGAGPTKAQGWATWTGFFEAPGLGDTTYGGLRPDMFSPGFLHPSVRFVSPRLTVGHAGVVDWDVESWEIASIPMEHVLRVKLLEGQLVSTAATLQTAINQTSTDIDLMALTQTALQTTLGTLQTTVQTNFGITSQAITSSFSELTQVIAGVESGLQSAIAERKTIIEQTAAGIRIGKSDSPYQCLLTNAKLSFLQSGVEIAYVSNNKLYIREAEILDNLTLSHWRMSSTAANDLVWRYV